MTRATLGGGGQGPRGAGRDVQAAAASPGHGALICHHEGQLEGCLSFLENFDRNSENMEERSHNQHKGL